MRLVPECIHFISRKKFYNAKHNHCEIDPTYVMTVRINDFLGVFHMVRLAFIARLLFAFSVFTTAAYAAKPLPTKEECEAKLEPAQVLYKALKNKKKSITILSGDGEMAVGNLRFVMSQINPEPSMFQFNQDFDATDNMPSTNAALTGSLWHRYGHDLNHVDLMIAEWLKIEGKKILTLNVSQISLRQQRELIDAFEKMPKDSDVHVLLFADRPESVIESIRDIAGNIHTAATKNLAATEARAKKVREVANELIKSRIQIFMARIIIKDTVESQRFASDVITLMSTLTNKDIEFFLMDGEELGLPPKERHAFMQKAGVTGSIMEGYDEPEKGFTGPSLEGWIDFLNEQKGNKSPRLVIVPGQFLTESENHAFKKWVQTLLQQSDGHLYRILIMDEK